MNDAFDSEFEKRIGLFAEDGGEDGGEGGGGGGVDVADADAPSQPAEPSGDGGQPDAGEPSVEDTSWRSGIKDPELKKVADRFTDPAAAIKAVRDLQRREGNTVRIPGKDASPEDRADFFRKMGVPDADTPYDFPVFEGEEITPEIQAEREDWMADFRDLGIPKDAGEALIAKFIEREARHQVDLREADDEWADAAMRDLQRTWGDDMEVNKIYAQRAVDRMFDIEDAAEHIELANGRYLLDHPVMLRAFAEIGRQMEDRNLGGVMSDDMARGLEDQANAARRAAQEAAQRGDRAEANRQSEIERELLGRIYGDTPVA